MIELNVTDVTLLGFLAEALFNKNSAVTADIDVLRLYEGAKEQGVFGLVYESASEIISADKLINQKWLSMLTSSLIQNEKVMNAQDELLDILGKNGISATVMKGASAAYLYPQPELRILGDIDFIVKSEDFDKTHNILIDNGYIDDNCENPIHNEYTKNGVMFELHRRPNGIPNSKIGTVILGILGDITERSVGVNIENHHFNMPCALHSALILLLHIQTHMQNGGLGLRQICDWAVFVASDMAVSSKDEILQCFEKTGLLKFACLTTKMCVNYLGLPRERVEWCMDAEDETCDLLIAEFLESGNFGRANSETRYASGMFLSAQNDVDKSKSKFVRFCRNFRQYSYDTMPITKKFKPLLIVAVVYLPIRFVFRIVTGKRPKINPAKMMKSVNERSKLFARLGIFDISEK